MRLQFAEEDWLHIIMAVRIGQKVLSQGEFYTAAWDTKRGNEILSQLLALVKRGSRGCQIATKIDLKHLVGMLPDSESDPTLVASAGPASDAALAARINDLETQVLRLMAQLEERKPESEPEGLREWVSDQNVRLFEHVNQLEDRLRDMERRRPRAQEGHNARQ